MKNFRDYLKESEEAADNPAAGDNFAINIREECLIESVVVESRDDGVVIAADEGMMQLLESYGYTFEENCMECGMSESDCGCDHEQVDEIAPVLGAIARTAIPMAVGAAMSNDDETNETRDPGEYDEEGDMAKNELYTMIRSARKLIGMLDNDDNMPEWTQKKINKATDYVDTTSDYISSQKERGVMEQSEEFSPVARATLHRIMMRHPGMLAQHGPERVMQAVDDVADLVGDMDDIGSSDVSGWVNMVQEILDSLDQDQSELEEGWKEKLGAAALAGSLAFGAGAAQAQSATKNQVSAKPVATQQASAKSDPFTVNGNTMRKDVRAAIMKMPDETGSNGWTMNGKPATPQQAAAAEKERAAAKAKIAAAKSGTVDKSAAATKSRRDDAFAELKEQDMSEAEYQGRKVPLGKPMRGDVKKSKVYVKNPQGNVVKVNFGDPNMKIKKSNPDRRKSFRARHNCDNPGPRTSARYWSCRAW